MFILLMNLFSDSGEMVANGINQNHVEASTPVQEDQVKLFAK